MGKIIVVRIICVLLFYAVSQRASLTHLRTLTYIKQFESN